MSEECQYCSEPATLTESVWGLLFWCLNCEQEAAWEIYNLVLEEGV